MAQMQNTTNIEDLLALARTLYERNRIGFLVDR